MRRRLGENLVWGFKVCLLDLTLNCLGLERLLVHLPLGEADFENTMGCPETAPTSPHTCLSLLAPSDCVGGGDGE